MNDKVQRAIRQVNEFWSKQEEGYINWDDVSEDFFKETSKREMMRKYGFTSFQYKALKQYMTGN
jgi:hypothetical protein